MLKVKAGALQLTIFIMVVIGLLLSTFLITVHLFDMFRTKTNYVVQSVKNINLGFDYARQNTISNRDTILLNLDSRLENNIQITTGFWGVYEKVFVQSNFKKNKVKKTALLGGKGSLESQVALYLEDKNKPLVLVGETAIKGTAYLPVSGVKTGHISGESYYGSQLIYGESEVIKYFPKINNALLKYLNNINHYYLDSGLSQFQDINVQAVFQNSFLDPFTVIYEIGDINLENIVITGQVIIQSKTRISVAATTQLNDVILIAPEIVINDYVKGKFQVIASENISVGENCVLNYPSALILNVKENTELFETPLNKTDRKIEIGKGTKVSGILGYLNEFHVSNYKSQILIGQESEVKGEIYCQGNLELQGKVFGTVYTSQFLVRKDGSIYQNHLYNAVINKEELIDEYVGLPFKNKRMDIVKWLY